MKKTVALPLLISLCLSLFLDSCSLRKDEPIEVWSRYDAFDGVGFDLDSYLLDLRKDNTIQIEPHDPQEGRKFVQQYEVIYSDRSELNFYVYLDVEKAKNAHQEEADMNVLLRHRVPHAVSIRIDNIVVTPGLDLSGESPDLDLLSNNRLIDFAKRIGIESEQIVLNKINASLRIARKDTDKSFESLLEIMEEKGFESIAVTSDDDDKCQIHTFVSSDKSVVYELVMCRGDGASAALQFLINELVMKSYNEHTHVYYSMGEDFCMYFAGSSADTRDLWDEIRK